MVRHAILVKNIKEDEEDDEILSLPKKRDGLVPPVLDSLDNYKILSERMNVLTIYLPRRKLPVASNLSIVKTAVGKCVCTFTKLQKKDKTPFTFM